MTPSHRPTAWLSRPLLGALAILALVLILEVPIGLIRGLIEERVATRGEALAEVTTTWGGVQSIIGPRLVIPYRDGPGHGGAERRFASFLPESLTIDGDVSARALTRGLFTVPVYEAEIRLRGRFAEPELSALGLGDAELQWDDASLVVELSDPKAVGGRSSVTWENEPVELLPGTRGSADRRGIHSLVTGPTDGSADFVVSLQLKGSTAIWFAPFARDTRLELTSNWPHPRFAGGWLPSSRELSRTGFSATWQVPFLGRDYEQAWVLENEPYHQIVESLFGVDLISPVDPYRMSERSTKYAPLFLVLTFGILWLFDTLVGVRVHPIQYLLVGAAMCLFYLLELSLSEHIGFVGAYFVAAVGVVTLIAMYTKAVLQSTSRGATIGASLGTLYAYLLALLSLERYALLAGSLGLFAALAVVMYSTRWVDWSAVVRSDDASAA